MSGTTVEFPSNSHSCTGYLATPASGRGPGVIVIQEWWGLVPHIKDVCDRLAAEGFTALAPDLYHGESTTEPDEAGKKMMALKRDEAARDMSGAVSWLLQSGHASGDAVGVMGFCMGGGLALLLASQRPEVRACAPFYAAGNWNIDFSEMKARVVGHWGARDASNPPQKVGELEAELKKAGVDGEFFFYDADHAFFNDTRPEVFAPDAARLAWERTLALFREQLTAERV